jgi:hypothetical protein
VAANIVVQLAARTQADMVFALLSSLEKKTPAQSTFFFKKRKDRKKER